MPSEISRAARVFSPWQRSVVRGTVCLICLFLCVVPSTAAAAKNKPARSAKPVFSVSTRDSEVTRTKVSHSGRDSSAPSAARADTALRSTDTIPLTTKAKKDSVIPAQSPQPVAKNAFDSLPAKPAAIPAVTQQKAVPIVVQNRTQNMRKAFGPHGRTRIMLIRLLVLLVCAIVILVAIRFVKKQKATPRFLTTTRLSVMDKEVQRACRYIEKNFADPDLSAEGICSDLVTGVAFLEALMERDLGVTVNDFIVHVRVNRAKQILAKDPAAGSEALSRETGFASESAFLASFRKLTGATFEAYAQRTRLRNG
jgi:AraC-like DNA-binding protein